MTSRLFTSALFAGLLAGLIAVLLQFFLMEPLILEAEYYESGAKVHFGGVITDTATDMQAEPEEAAVAHVEGDGHSHETAGDTEEDESNVARFALAFFMAFVTWVAYGLLMIAGFAIAERLGQTITVSAGLLWGIAGFVSFQMMPGLGLPPNMPGVPSADLTLRQIWWIGAVISTVMAMVAFGYGRRPVFIAVGVGLLIAPHLIGAPSLGEFLGNVPPGLATAFVTRSLVVGLAAWVVLGVVAGYFWRRQPVPT